MAKNLAPTPPGDKHLANELSLKAPSSPAMLEPSAVRATGAAPTDKGPQGSKSGAMNSRLARKKSGLLNDPADAFDEIQSSPSQDTVLGADLLETAAATEPMGASSPLDVANLEASGAELSAYGAPQASAFGEPLVLAQALVDAPLAATLSSTSANASAAAATAASSIGAGGFMALAGMIVVASRAAATHKAPTTQPTETPTTTSLSLVVQDGYLDGAEVWVDMNDNGVIDALVDFKFGISVNGQVDGALTDAQKLHALITTGGTDISTGLAFQGSYSATAGSTVVNPLTSLVQSMVQSSMGSTAGMTDAQKLARITEVKAEALTAINSALGLPLDADLTRIDTILTATASTGDAASGISLEQALVINSKALMVANMMAMGAAALQGASSASGGVPSMSTFSNFIVQGIVAAINEAAASGETVALGDSDSLTAILTSASTAATTAATATGGSFAMDSTKLSAANAAVATSVASTNSLITTLTGNAITANATNPGSATGALTQMLAAQKAVLSQLDELQDNDVSVLNTFTDVAAVFTASQSAENTAGLKLGTQAVTAPVIEEDNSYATVTAVTVKPVKAGDLAQFVVQLSEGVFIQATGQNKLTIAIQNTATSEAIATYDPGLSSGDKLVFTYKVKDGDTLLGVAPGTSIQLPEGSGIMDLAGNEADRNLNSGLQNFQAAEVVGRTLDTLAPTLSITSDKEALKSGETATITFTFSEDPATSFAWDGTAGDIAVTGGTLTAISGSGLTRTATFTPTASLASGSASITVAGASYLDAAGNNGGAGTSPSISLDTLAPVAVFSAIKDANGDLLTAGPTTSTSLLLSGSNELGSTVSVYNGSTLLGQAQVTETNWTYSVSAKNGEAYHLKITETDLAGHISASKAYLPGAGNAVIDLGVVNGVDYGQLIAPVQVDGGKWFYYWDRNGNDVADDEDVMSRFEINQIFNEDSNGVQGSGTTDTVRFATLNGMHLALPTLGLSNPNIDLIALTQAGTAVGSATNGVGDNTVNTAYDDLLAIWDAYNGDQVSLQGVEYSQDMIGGLPPNWLNYSSGLYASATPSFVGGPDDLTRHYTFMFGAGAPSEMYDGEDATQTPAPVALQVIDPSIVIDTRGAPVMTGAATASVQEGAAGTVYTASATQAGSTLTYALGGADAALFNINESTGAVTFLNAPDFEAPGDVGDNNVYNIDVTASNGVYTSLPKAVAITVSNVYEAPVMVPGASWATSFNEGALSSQLHIDVTEPSRASVVLDTVNQQLDFSALSSKDLFPQDPQDPRYTPYHSYAPYYRDDAPIVWADLPEVQLGQAWSVQTRVSINDGLAETNQFAGIGFYNVDGDVPNFHFSLTKWIQPTYSLSDVAGVATQSVRGNGISGDAYTLLAPETSDVYLKVQVTELGLTDHYQFFYKGLLAQDTWTAVGDARTYTAKGNDSRVGLFYKTNQVTAGVTFDDFAITVPVSVAENSTGTVYTASATADASSTLTYALSGTDSALFSINANSGEVAFKAAPNFEDPRDASRANLYDLTVTASDGVETSVPQSVVIAVTNVVELSAVNVTVAPAQVAEGDASKLTYTFTRSNDFDRELTVNIGVAGTAGPEDYSRPMQSQWTRLMGASRSPQAPTSAAVGADGAVYVSGRADSSLLDGTNVLSEYGGGYVRKFDTDGSLVWTRLTDAVNDNYPNSVTTGADGGVYVAGMAYNPAAYYDGFVTKFDSAGALEWTSFVGGPGYDYIKSVSSDAKGAVYVAGLSYDVSWTTTSPFLSKLDIDGILIWNRPVASNDLAISASPTTDGAVYVTGYSNSAILDGENKLGEYGSYVSKYDAQGNLKWTRLPVASGYGQTNSVSAGADGAVYVAGYAYNAVSQNNDGFVAKFDAAGTLVWTSFVGGSGHDDIKSVFTGEDGAVYLAGETYSSSLNGQVIQGAPNTTNGFVGKLDADDGTLAWTHLIGGASNDLIKSISVDADGVVYIAGETYSSSLDGQNNQGNVAGFVSKILPASLTQVTFAPGSATATLTLKATSDAVTEGNQIVTVTVALGNGYTIGTASAATGTIEDNLPPVITSDPTATAAENSTGTVYTAIATDANAGSTLAYALDGTDADLFDIVAATGAVTFKAAPNFEAPLDGDGDNVYDITVTASDGVNTTEKAVAITVTYVDTEAPVAVFSAINDSDEKLLTAGYTNSDTLLLHGSNEEGSTVKVYNGSDLLGLAEVTGTSWSYSIATSDGESYTLKITETDLAGNVSEPKAYLAGAGDAVIDLGVDKNGVAYGQLIAPVQVDGGKWFYHWDVSGDGTATDRDDTSQPKDYVLAWRLHDIFKNDVNGNVGLGTSETYRYATLNGVHLALPTIGLPGKDLTDYSALTDSKDWISIVQANTVIGSVEGEGDNTINPLYDDLLAIWDAHNGTAISAVQIGEPWVGSIRGTPKDWNSAGWGEYASATPSYRYTQDYPTEHYSLFFNGGLPNFLPEGQRDSNYNVVLVALQVLDRPVIVVDTLAPVSPTIALGLGVSDGATSTEAEQNTGVVTITAETGASTVVTFTNGQEIVIKTVTGNGATAVPVVLTAEEVTDLGEGEVSVRAVARDAAGNASDEGVSTFTRNTEQPPVTIAFSNTVTMDGATKGSDSNIANLQTTAIKYTLTTSVPVQGLDIHDFVVTNGEVTSVHPKPSFEFSEDQELEEVLGNGLMIVRDVNTMYGALNLVTPSGQASQAYDEIEAVGELADGTVVLILKTYGQMDRSTVAELKFYDSTGEEIPGYQTDQYPNIDFANLDNAEIINSSVIVFKFSESNDLLVDLQGNSLPLPQSSSYECWTLPDGGTLIYHSSFSEARFASDELQTTAEAPGIGVVFLDAYGELTTDHPYDDHDFEGAVIQDVIRGAIIYSTYDADTSSSSIHLIDQEGTKISNAAAGWNYYYDLHGNDNNLMQIYRYWNYELGEPPASDTYSSIVFVASDGSLVQADGTDPQAYYGGHNFDGANIDTLYDNGVITYYLYDELEDVYSGYIIPKDGDPIFIKDFNSFWEGSTKEYSNGSIIFDLSDGTTILANADGEITKLSEYVDESYSLLDAKGEKLEILGATEFSSLTHKSSSNGFNYWEVEITGSDNAVTKATAVTNDLGILTDADEFQAGTYYTPGLQIGSFELQENQYIYSWLENGTFIVGDYELYDPALNHDIFLNNDGERVNTFVLIDSTGKVLSEYFTNDNITTAENNYYDISGIPEGGMVLSLHINEPEDNEGDQLTTGWQIVVLDHESRVSLDIYISPDDGFNSLKSIFSEGLIYSTLDDKYKLANSEGKTLASFDNYLITADGQLFLDMNDEVQTWDWVTEKATPLAFTPDLLTWIVEVKPDDGVEGEVELSLSPDATIANDDDTPLSLGTVTAAPVVLVDTIAPVFEGGASADTTSVEEGSIGTVYTAIATDSGSTLTYGLAGDDADWFDIDEVSGAVTFKDPPNYETQDDADGDNVYNITVTASDGANMAEKDVEITVEDVVSVVALTVGASALEGGNLVYTFTRSGDIGDALSVKIGYGGTASPSDDYANDGPFSKSWSTLVGGSGQDHLRSITAKPDGGFYAVGQASYYSTSNPMISADGVELQPLGDSDGFIRKFAADGTEQWTRLYGGSTSDDVTSVIVDADGSAYVTGYYYDGGHYDKYITKFTSAGIQDWTFGNDVLPQGASQASLALAPDDGSILFIGGSYYGGSGFSTFLTKMTLNDSGPPDTSSTVYLTQRTTQAIAAAGNGVIYLTGYTDQSIEGQSYASGGDAFLSKLNGDGTIAWSRLIGGSSWDSGTSVVVGSDGGVYVAGFLDSSYFVNKFDANGESVWSTTIANGSNYASSLAIGSDGFVYLSGITTQAIDGQASLGGNDAFVTRIDPENGQRTFTQIVGSDGDDRATTIAAGPNGAILIGGTAHKFYGAVYDNLQGMGSLDGFVTQFAPPPLPTTVAFAPGSATATLTIKTKADDLTDEGNETLSVTIQQNQGYSIGSFASAIGTIEDNLAPVITSANTVSVSEGSSGTIYTATATDTNAGSTLTYALSGTDAALFNISASTGALSFKAAPNFEASGDAGGDNVYDFTVTASDGLNTTAPHAVAITVTNANEAPVNTYSFMSTLGGLNWTTVGAYSVHSFTNVGSTTLTVAADQTIHMEALLVAGGAAGAWSGNMVGAGGGGGGVAYIPSFNISNATYTITVGAGGTTGSDGWYSINNPIHNGGITSLTSTTGQSVTVYGGGTGGGNGGDDGTAGGSGGGGHWDSGQGGAAIPGTATGIDGVVFYGNGGGQSDHNKTAGGGGGGATSAGANATLGGGGNGGEGLVSAITGTAVVYGSGGGGGGNDSSGLGGVNGGNATTSSADATNGVANTGGGGGGSGGPLNGNGGTGMNGSGGSGIVVLRYIAGIEAQANTPYAIKGIQIGDPDATNSFTVTFIQTHGVLAVAVNVVGGLAASAIAGNNSGSVTLTGNLAQINATLAASNGLVLTMDAGFSGPATLTMRTTDGPGAFDEDVISVTTVADTTAPSATLTAGTSPNTGNATVQSSEAGTAYLVKTGGTNPVTVTSLANITEADDAKWNSFSVAAASTATSLSLTGLEDGTYSLYTIDAAGNLSAAASNTYAVDNTAPILDIQYAVSATASSTYGQSPGTGWSTWQILGAPDSTFEGDGKAWAPLLDNNPNAEWVEVGFSSPVHAESVVIKEIFQHGFVTRLDLVDVSENYYTVWEGIDTTPSSGKSSVDFEINFPKTDYLVSRAKVYVNSMHGESWEQIESIGLVTQPWTLATSTIEGTAGDSAGETIALTLTFDGNVNGLNSGDNNTIFTVAGSGVLATWSGSGSTRTLTYTIAAGQNGQAAVDEVALKAALIAGIADAAGNAFVYNGNIPAIDASPLPVVDARSAGTSSIDLGSYGQLIAPVQVEGKWYYHWDRDGDGTSAGDAYNRDDGTYRLSEIYNLFKQDINGDAGPATDDTYRYAVINGVKLALPELGAAISANLDGTLIDDAQSTNSTYDGLAAIWDAHNGAQEGSYLSQGLDGNTTSSNGYDSGVPPGWVNDTYVSATPQDGEYAFLRIYDGLTGPHANWGMNVALQVLP